VAAFLIPSALFWGSGILKDTITMAAFNILLYHVYFLLKLGNFGVKKVVIILLMSILIFKLKSYIIIAFVPCLAYMVYKFFENKISNGVVRVSLRPVLLAVFGFVIYFGLIGIADNSEKYKLESLEQQTRGFHTWHTTTAGSAYNLGEIEYTAASVASKIPAALNVSFFRPYFWESRNFVMLISAIESSTFFLLFIYALFKWKLNLLKGFDRSPFLIGLLIFILLFGFAIGFTSYNFGALMRYKIPISPLAFFMFFLLVFKIKTTSGSSDNI
jgi:hypothetical protein